MEDLGGPKEEVKLNEIYLAIISRYKDYIEEKEELSVAELPTLVTPQSDAVVRRAEAIRQELGQYDYQKNFYDAAVLAFEFVRDEIEEVVLPVQFWLSPDETIRFRMGDRIDRCILLCSLLVALGNPSSKVFVLKDEGSRKVYVYFEFNGLFILLDVEDGVKEFKDNAQMLSFFNITEDDTVYEFNNQSYADVYLK